MKELRVDFARTLNSVEEPISSSVEAAAARAVHADKSVRVRSMTTVWYGVHYAIQASTFMFQEKLDELEVVDPEIRCGMEHGAREIRKNIWTIFSSRSLSHPKNRCGGRGKTLLAPEKENKINTECMFTVGIYITQVAIVTLFYRVTPHSHCYFY